MSTIPLVIAPNPILKKLCEPVDKIDKQLQQFMDDMLETMYHEHGAGLAANQVGVLKRIITLDLGLDDDHTKKDPHFLINPEIVWYSEELQIYPEGCLSFPGGYLEISRPKTVRVQYTDYHGKEQEKEFTGWFARGVQHELDHLNGMVHTDRVSKLKGDLLMRKVIKYKKLNNK